MGSMDTGQIVAALIQERDKLNAAIEALQEAPKKGPAIETGPRTKRHVSASSRRKMALGQKKRWATLKAAKSAASGTRVAAKKKTSPRKAPVAPKKKTLSKDAAFRKKMSERMKAAWAARKEKAAGKATGA